MSSNFDNLVEVITDLVLRELSGEPTGSVAAAQSSGPAAAKDLKAQGKGPRVLVAPGPGGVEQSLWTTFSENKALRVSALVWNGYRQDQLPASCSDWSLEARSTNWGQVVSEYKSVVLLGSDLSVLGALANLGCGGCPPASVAIAGLSSGLPIFVDDGQYESLRRHSSRLSSGFVRRFEELFRIASSFGIEFGGSAQLAEFLRKTAGSTSSPVLAESRSGGRDVVTVEDVEAVKRAGQAYLAVALGTIVTPLAAQRALEWGIEVRLQ